MNLTKQWAIYSLALLLVLLAGSLVDLAAGQQRPAGSAAANDHAGHQHHSNPSPQPGKIQTNSADTQRPTRQAMDMPKSSIIIDLSHPLNERTIHWPANSGFNYSVLQDGELKNQQDKPFYLKMDNFTTAIHTGTHIDAPVHFNKQGWTIDQIPLERLIEIPLIVVDVSQKVKANRSYNFLKGDFLNGKTMEPLIKPRSVVLVYTGVSEDYDKGEQKYYGTSTGDTKKIDDMRIPGWSKEAAEFMAEVGVYGVGLDSPSADSSDRHGANNSMNPDAHIALNGKNIYILENVNKRLKELIGQSGFSLTIAPLPIVGGSGSPVRLIAVSQHQHPDSGCDCLAHNSAPSQAANYPTSMICLSLLAISFGLVAGVHLRQ